MSDVAKQLRQRADWDTPHCNELLAAAREIEEYEAALKLQVTYAELLRFAAVEALTAIESDPDIERGWPNTVALLREALAKNREGTREAALQALTDFHQEHAPSGQWVPETCTKPNETREGRWDYDDQDRTFYHTDFSTDAMLKLDGDWASVDQRITFAARVLKALAGEFCHQSCTKPEGE